MKFDRNDADTLVAALNHPNIAHLYDAQTGSRFDGQGSETTPGLAFLAMELVEGPTLAERITEALQVPVIGIGAGPATDGQILVLYDVLGITTGRKPRFVLDCMQGASGNLDAMRRYVQAVKSLTYPAPEHCFS